MSILVVPGVVQIFFTLLNKKHCISVQCFFYFLLSTLIYKILIKRGVNMVKEIKILSLFSGIGAFEKALTRLGIQYELVGFSEVDKYAIKSYCAIHNIDPSLNIGDISKVDEKSLPDFELITYGFPCFTAGTLIMTDKGYRKIEDIEAGDYVLTHTGRFKKVLKTMKRKTNEIYRLKTMCSEDLLVTEEHPFYVRKMKRIWDNTKRRHIRVFDNPQWVKVKDLNEEYYVGLVINKKEELPSWYGYKYYKHKTEKHVNTLDFTDKNFWWLVGRYLGDGWISIQKRKNHPNSPNYRTIICCGKNELKEVLERLDGLFKYSVSEERTVYKIHIVNKELTLYLMQFGRGAKNKKLTKDIFNLPVEYLKEFLEGYISADGYKGDKNIRVSSVSPELIYGIGYCIAKVYKRPFSVYKYSYKNKSIIEGREVNQSDVFEIRFKLTTDKQDKAFYEDGYIWFPIYQLKKENIKTYVYNMEVEEDNSYTANNIIVHNCQDLSVAGKQKGLIDKEGNKTRSGLLFDVLRIIKHKKPKYAIAENVKGLVSKKFKKDFDWMLAELESYGYNNYWKVLNAKDYGIPQNRERVFIISIRKDIDDGSFKFPEPLGCKLRLRDLLEKWVDEKYYIPDDKVKQLIDSLKDKAVHPIINVDKVKTRHWGRRIKQNNEEILTLTATDRHGILINNGQIKVKEDETSSCLDANYHKGLDNHGARTGILEVKPIFLGYLTENKTKSSLQGRRVHSEEGTSITITASGGGLGGHSGLYLVKNNRKINDKTLELEIYFRIRRLTPLECWRLMGFDDEDFWKAKNAGISNTQLYKQAGNSIVVNVLEEIFRNVFTNYISDDKNIKLVV